MRCPLWSRTLRAFFAIWLALVMGEAGFVHHHCPMHDGPLPAAHGSDSHASHEGHNAGHGQSDTSGHDGQHACTCIGACSIASGALAVEARPALPIAAIKHVEASAPRATNEFVVARRIPFAQPFPNGPPPAVA